MGLGLLTAGTVPAAARPRPASPNILFIILDDVGADQIRAFNPSLVTVPTPNIEAVVQNGVKFSKFWAMPECSPSRACFFTGRYPLRTGVTAALLPQDLPGAQVSPYEVTIPKVLEKAGYDNALIGKYHLGGPENNPAGNMAPRDTGWKYFDGSLSASPPLIDTSIGGQHHDTVTTDPLYPCGFPTGSARGAAWFQDAQGNIACDDNNGAGYTGQEAVRLGGIPALDGAGNFAPTCAQAQPVPPDFAIYNAYYAWPHVVIEGDKFTSTTSRTYMTTAQTDGAVSWINRNKANKKQKPWMCTVSYSAIHTPYQQPPTDLYPKHFTWPAHIEENVMNLAAQKIISDLMLIAMDKEIGRLLVGAGLATWGDNGELVYTPELTDTMVIIAGDNGTFFPSVNFPYNHLRSKGTPYETGVSTPLAIAGPLVSQPGRDVASLVNCVDLFQLFGEIAGLNVHNVVPPPHKLDSFPMLSYLTNPGQHSLRSFNYTELGNGLKPPSVHLWPCVLQIGSDYACTDILFTSQEICETENGTWYGPVDGQPIPPYPTCCDVKVNVKPDLKIAPLQVWAVRNDRYKLVKSSREPCDALTRGELEFYDLMTTPTNPVGLDVTDLLTTGQPVNLTSEQMVNFLQLQTALESTLASEPDCQGDGNLDKKVNAKDRRGVRKLGGQPSVFDMNSDGTTDNTDEQIVRDNLGNNCVAP